MWIEWIRKTRSILCNVSDALLLMNQHEKHKLYNVLNRGKITIISYRPTGESSQRVVVIAQVARWWHWIMEWSTSSKSKLDWVSMNIITCLSVMESKGKFIWKRLRNEKAYYVRHSTEVRASSQLDASYYASFSATIYRSAVGAHTREGKKKNN